MAKIWNSRTVRGRIDRPLEWTVLESFFDSCFGSGKRSLPGFPEALGHIFARWHDENGAIHEADSLEELGNAYRRRVTYQIEFSGAILPNPPENLSFVYKPRFGDATFAIRTSSNEVFDGLISGFKQLFPFPIGCVFISYDTRELYLAEFLKALLEKRLGSGIPVFVAKRDIRVGDDPTKKMIRENLYRANAVVSICTPFSKNSPWLWWETATVWAHDQLVVPLFAGITPKEFNGPITVLLQGRQLFDRSELMDALREVGQRMVPSLAPKDLTDDEEREYSRLRDFHLTMHSTKGDGDKN